MAQHIARSVREALLHGTWVIDLDGVVWLAGVPIPGSGEAVNRLKDAGIGVLFATNNAEPTREELLGRLVHAGIRAEVDDLVSSAQAAAAMLAPGSTALAYAGPGVPQALAERAVDIVREAPADAVVIGWARQFDFDLLSDAMAAVRGGARLIGTNEDPTHPTPDRLLPGTGALLAAVATASERVPEVAGKPHRAMMELIKARATDISVVVGDRPTTDGVLAKQLDVPYALVLSGVTSTNAVIGGSSPDLQHGNLAELVTAVLDG
ncbi:MAG: HAD-IIA family hydrolase [Acidimicrobiales bacterium]